MSTNYSVLSILSDNVFHSGEDIARSLQISRASVWKVIQNLRKKGLEINSIRGRGYRLNHVIDLLSAREITNSLPPSLNKRFKIETHFELTSTNDYLIQQDRSCVDYTVSSVCLAEYQRSGKGRRGRTWQSPLSTNLYMSLTWQHKLSPRAVSGFSLVTAVALANCLEHLGVEGVQLKWPNDVLWNQRKIAGILLEVAGESHGDQALVIGLGVNVALPESARLHIDQPWTDLLHATGRYISRNMLASQLLIEIYKYFCLYEERGMEALFIEWNSRDAYLHKNVDLIFPNQKISGKVAGIDEQGSLLLDLGDGIQKAYQSGEVSLRTGETKIFDC